MTDVVLARTARDERTLACPLCPFTLDVPPVPVSDALGSVFGVSGSSLARVHADQAAGRASQDMRAHLGGHSVEEWLGWGYR